MIFLYRIITLLFYPIFVIIIFYRKIIKKEDTNRFKEKIFSSSFNIKRKDNTKLIWFHASSIGEFKSVLPIISELNKIEKNLEFLITTATLSSGNLATEELKKFSNVYHRFFPFDVGFLINKFLTKWKPSSIFLVDSEIWPNLISYASEKKINISLINARITRKSFLRWKLLPGFNKSVFSKFNFCLTSNLETSNFLGELGAKNISYLGNLKFVHKVETDYKNDLNNDFFKKKKFWFAASTHEGEESFCIETHLKIKKNIEKIITIIAPRHINRSNAIKNICNNLKLNTQILNKDEVIQDDMEIIIINSFGKLSNFFRHAKSVFIGKSLIKRLQKDAGQSPIDAANLGCKVYHGPYVYNFREVYETLKENNISQEINSQEELANYLIKDLSQKDKEISKYSEVMKSLSKKILNDYMTILRNTI
tara:strand:+ start:5806 stop:7074 length:1269 start_codon:yes stop_codon:yes gene_type:complete